MKTDLSSYNNDGYNPGGGIIKRILWYMTNIIWFKSGWFGLYPFKRFLLRLFGAKVGEGVIIKPSVNIKYPWNLSVDNHVWIGEGVWIDNLGKVVLGDHVCISQGAMLLCGNHNFTKPAFDLIVGDITIEEGGWIGAKALVGPGVTVHSHAVLSAGSIASSDLEAYKIYRGNPAVLVKDRIISE